MAGRGGRPRAPIRAETTEEKALAEFLRARVDASGKTPNTLAGEIHRSKSQISEYLAGKAPDRQVVVDLIKATVADPRLRKRYVEEADKLLRAAAHPAPVKSPPPVASALELAEARAQQIEIYDRLTRSLEQQNELREAAANSSKLVMALLLMISKLERRITDLAGERDQLHAGRDDTDTLRQTQLQLTRAREQEERAQQELQRAQEKQQQAEELAVRVQARVDQLTGELDQLRTGTASSFPDSENTSARGPARGATVIDPVGDDMDQALAQAAAVNDQDDQILQRITQDLTQNVLPEDGVVHGNSPDNPVTSHFTADNLPVLRAAAETAAETGDYDKADQLYAAYVSIRFLGPDHPDSLSARYQLALWRGKAVEEASVPMVVAEVVADHERVHGADAIATRHQLLRWRVEEAEAVVVAKAFGELVADYERVHGADHPDTLAVRYQLAYWQGAAKSAASAKRAFAKLVADYERVHGADHPDTLAARHQLAYWRGIAGNAAGAAKAFAELIADYERVHAYYPNALATRSQRDFWRQEASSWRSRLSWLLASPGLDPRAVEPPG
ncbi:helix-turn-helix domain-containing protein [Streptomyces geranii]|uniref:helix-turn-helix domain-containing protein n=1 Tax=Streptomyces geranii TaxID=2058923 RepID=UPI000D03DBE2|nr:helix-turn-helix transcriptional regulator [Streptomyces geranii]